MLCSLPALGQILTLPVIHYLGCGTGAATCLVFTWYIFDFFAVALLFLWECFICFYYLQIAIHPKRMSLPNAAMTKDKEITGYFPQLFYR